MKFIKLLLQIAFLNMCRSWEYCRSDVQSKLCGDKKHFVCDPKNSITNVSCMSKEFLAHVPLTRKVKAAFLNWHNYYRNRTAGGWAKKKKIYFPRAVRMRELIWDSELSYLSHVRTKLVSDGDVSCHAAQRFAGVEHNLIVQTLNEHKPVLEIIALSLRKMFNEKKRIKKPTEMPKEYKERNQFINIINDRVSRVGCAVALGADCKDKKDAEFKFCYYTACSYDADLNGDIYKIGKPTGRCSHWGGGKSETYMNLCKNSGEIFGPDRS